MKILDGVRYSMVALQPCPSTHITADKRFRCITPKLPSATSFIRNTLVAIGLRRSLTQKIYYLQKLIKDYDSKTLWI